MSKKEEENINAVSVTKRLDAIISLLIEMNKPKTGEKFNEATAARLLKSLDFTPTEIARLLGKKSRTDVTCYLYPKKKAPKGKGKQSVKQTVKPSTLEASGEVKK